MFKGEKDQEELYVQRMLILPIVRADCFILNHCD